MPSINKKLEFVLDLQSHRFNTAVRDAQKRIDKLARKYVSAGSRFGKTSRDMREGIDSISTQLERSQNRFRDFFLIGGSTGVALNWLGRTADEMKGLNARLKLVTGSQVEFNRIQQQTLRIANRTRTSLSTTVDLYTRIARATRNLNVDEKDRLAVVEAINNAGLVSGADPASANAAITQLLQGLQSGVLRGEEFNSIMEQFPRLAEAIAAGMGIPFEKLREEAQEGRLVTEEVFNAILTQAQQINAEAAAIPATIGQSFTVLVNNLKAGIGQFDEATGITSRIAAGIRLLADNFGALAKLLGGAILVAVSRFTSTFITGSIARLAAIRAEQAEHIKLLGLLKAEAAAAVVAARNTNLRAVFSGNAEAVRTTSKALRETQIEAAGAGAALSAATQKTGLLSRAMTLLKSPLKLLGGPIGLIVTGIGSAIAAWFKYRDTVINVAGENATVTETIRAGWDLVMQGAVNAWQQIKNVATTRLNEMQQALEPYRQRAESVARLIMDKFGAAWESAASIARASINGVINIMVGMGRSVGVIARSIVLSFKAAFSNVVNLAKAAGKDVAAAMTLDFSGSNMKAAIRDIGEGAKAEMRRVAGELSDSFDNVDYVGKAGDAISDLVESGKRKFDELASKAQQTGQQIEEAIARRISQNRATDQNDKLLQNVDQAKVEPFKIKSAEADNSKLKAALKEREQLIRTSLDNEFALARDTLDREERDLINSYENRKISIRQFYEEKKRLAQAAIDAELQQKRGELELARKKKDLSGIASIENEIILLERKRRDVAVDSDRQAKRALDDHRRSLADLRDELKQITGTQTSNDRRSAIERSLRDQLEQAKAEGDSAAVGDIQKLINVRAAKADLDSFQEKYSQTMESMRNVEESLRIQREAGLITETEFREKLIALHQRTADEVDKLIPGMEKMAGIVGSPDSLNRVEQFKNKIKELRTVSDETAERVRSNFQRAFADMFYNFTTGAKSMKEAFKDFARSVIKNIQRIIAERLSEQLFGRGGSLSGGGSSGGGIFAAISKFIAGFFHAGGIVGSEGGRIAVPAIAFAGAPQYHAGGIAGLKPNEVPAILERGEEVLTRDDPRHRYNARSKPEITINVQTPDANSFEKSRDQVLQAMREAQDRANSRNG